MSGEAKIEEWTVVEPPTGWRLWDRAVNDYSSISFGLLECTLRSNQQVPAVADRLAVVVLEVMARGKPGDESLITGTTIDGEPITFRLDLENQEPAEASIVTE